MASRFRLASALLMAALAAGGVGPSAQDRGGAMAGDGRAAFDERLRAAQIKLGREQVYSDTADRRLMLDILYPLKVSGPRPLILFLHGGGWSSGTKSDIFYSEYSLSFAAHGFITASVNYRLAPKDAFPAAIEDVKCALRYLRAHAAAYQIDAERVGVFGEEAGGHLAVLMGVAGPEAGFEGTSGEWPGWSTRVRAAAALFSPMSLAGMRAGEREGELLGVFGAASLDDPRLARFSPITWAGPGDPPVLLLQSAADPVVPRQTAEDFAAIMKDAGVAVTIVGVQGGGFGWGPPRRRGTDPTHAEIAEMVAAFFDDCLR